MATMMSFSEMTPANPPSAVRTGVTETPVSKRNLAASPMVLHREGNCPRGS